MPVRPDCKRRRVLIGAGLLAAAVPALVLAQESLLPPGFNEAAPATEQRPGSNIAATPDSSAGEAARTQRPARGEDSSVVTSDSLSDEELEKLPAPPPPIELPAGSRRDPRVVGAIDPAVWGFGVAPWGGANGRFLGGLMRRLDTPLPSRWLHITLRNALLSKSPAPPAVHPVDWVAERAWLLLRMGEADAAAMLVAGVDVADFTDKLTQVAVQSALASSDPAALCPLREPMRKLEPKITALTGAMCAAIEGQASSASTQIEQARRRGPIVGIDHVLADKVVGAGADTGRAATVEWDGVEGLTAWRFGLASATGLAFPARLIDAAPPRVRAWQARAPMLAPEDRLASARVATALGVFSSAALTDLYSAIYDRTDPSDLGESDAWQLRLAFTARDPAQRVAAMRRLWGEGKDPIQARASEALLAHAASRIAPDAVHGADVPRLIAAMLAGGFDRQAARWAGVTDKLDEDADVQRAWALLALGTEAPVDLSESRIEDFLDADQSAGKHRGRLLVAGLAGTGRIDTALASRLDEAYGLGLGRSNNWTRIARQAAAGDQSGSAVLLAAVGLQSERVERLPPAHVFRALSALRATGLGWSARMIAAELLSRG